MASVRVQIPPIELKRGETVTPHRGSGHPARNPQGLCLDKGYDYDEVRDLCSEFGFTCHVRSRGEETKALASEAGFRARRWVVERSKSL
jgi:transposase